MKSFTLVETLVAIALMSITIVGPFQIVQGVLQSSYIARDQLIAAALAQEGMEYVRNVRDSNFIYNNHHSAGQSWLQGLDGTAGPDCYTNACIVDVTVPTVASCGNTTCTSPTHPLYLAAGNLYNQSGSGSVTRFNRMVRLTSISSTETMVTITVTWDYHGTHSVVLVENLRSWL
jgi:Tfp pilus assembly protein PilV